MDKLPSLHELTLTPTIPNVLFRWLLLLAIVAFSAIWFIDYQSNIIAPFDAAAYPICIGSFVTILCLSLFHNSTKIATYLHFFTFTVVAGYLISSSAWHHLDNNGEYSNSAQWLGINYVVAYLFLEVRKAAPTTLLVFFITIASHYYALSLHHSPNEALGVLANIIIANLVYMILLWTALRMRVDGEVLSQQAKVFESHALKDPLTHIHNRRSLDQLLQTAQRHWQTKNKRYSILMIDIDDFKHINDMYGRSVGDRVLLDFVSCLNRLLNNSEEVARWGEEEFIVLAKEHSKQEVKDLAELIRQHVQTQAFAHQSTLTVSIGIGHCEEGSEFSDILEIADYNLFSAKNSGRDKVMDTISTNNLTRLPAPEIS